RGTSWGDLDRARQRSRPPQRATTALCVRPEAHRLRSTPGELARLRWPARTAGTHGVARWRAARKRASARRGRRRPRQVGQGYRRGDGATSSALEEPQSRLPSCYPREECAVAVVVAVGRNRRARQKLMDVCGRGLLRAADSGRVLLERKL